MSLVIEGCIKGHTKSIMKSKVWFMCNPSTLVVDRETNGDKCPKCGGSVEIMIYEVSPPSKPTFDDLWTCCERDCGVKFIMRTKRE